MRNPKPPATKSANSPTRKTPVVDSFRLIGGTTGDIGGAVLSEGDCMLDGGAGGNWGGTGEGREPGCEDCEALAFERTGVRGGIAGKDDSPGRTNMTLSNSCAISADEPKSSIKPLRRIEFPSSESTEIGL